MTTTTFPTPILNITGCRPIIDDALARREDHGEQRTETVLWEDAQRTVPVVRLPLDAVRLNPFSRRLRANLEGHPQRDLIRDDPFGREAQDILADLLRRDAFASDGIDPEFKKMVNGLQEEGQREVGCVTREGVLVDGNTRATALRQIGIGYILVAVLPGGASIRALQDLELDIQVRRRIKRKYTFSNELLAMQELLDDRGLPADQVARRLGITVKNVQVWVRSLCRIREAQAWSREDGDAGLPLIYFDNKRKAFEELDEAVQDYNRTGASCDAVRSLEQARLLGLLAGWSQMAVRAIRSDIVEGGYLCAEIAQSPLAALVAPVAAGPSRRLPGLPFGLPTPVCPQQPPVTLERLARRGAIERGRLVQQKLAGSEGTWQSPAQSDVLDQVGSALRTATENAACARPDAPEVGKAARQIQQAADNLRAAYEALAVAEKYSEAGVAELYEAFRDVTDERNRLAEVIANLQRPFAAKAVA